MSCQFALRLPPPPSARTAHPTPLTAWICLSSSVPPPEALRRPSRPPSPASPSSRRSVAVGGRSLQSAAGRRAAARRSWNKGQWQEGLEQHSLDSFVAATAGVGCVHCQPQSPPEMPRNARWRAARTELDERQSSRHVRRVVDVGCQASLAQAGLPQQQHWVPTRGWRHVGRCGAQQGREHGVTGRLI